MPPLFSLIFRQPEALGSLPHAPVIMWHLRVGHAQMREGVIDGIGKSRDAADIG